MALKVGSVAPAFKLFAKIGEEHDLGQLIGREKIVLMFFPLAFSTLCTEEMCSVRDEWSGWADLGADCRVFGVSIDSLWVTDRFRQEYRLPFPVLSDFNKEMSAAYEALHADFYGMRGVTKRAAIVIGRDGRVAYSWESDPAHPRMDREAIRAALKAAP